MDLLSWRGDVTEMGTTVCYHTGMICNDRIRDPKVQSIAADAMELYEAGRVLLTQRKIGPLQYEYLVTSCDMPRVPKKI